MTTNITKNPVAVTTNKQDLLAEVAQRGHEAIEGYRLAGMLVESREITERFHKYVNERKGMLMELDSLAPHQDLIGNIDTSLIAALHRRWMELKAELSGDTDKAVVEECLRGEQASLDSYAKLIQAPQQSHERKVLDQHMRAIQMHMEYLQGLIQ